MRVVSRGPCAPFAAILFVLVTITGELVETYCWLTHGVGGAAHAKCGIECAKRGVPVAVYDAVSRKVYVLMPGHNTKTLPPQLIEAMGKPVTITGEMTARGGSTFLAVQQWQVKR